MEKEYKGTLFKVMMTAAFLTGAIAYFFALMYVSEPLCKVGFGFLALLSLLCAAGMNAADISGLEYIRPSTKLAAFFFPFSVNGGGLCTEILLMRGMGTAAFIVLIAACIISVISSSALVRRYMEDDF
ncbi:MAG: hypothetical protein J6K92_03100 [Oscillospiraceae bacterium]|nr:hypothetical protein [Oscillospiraceae bacterium]